MLHLLRKNNNKLICVGPTGKNVAFSLYNLNPKIFSFADKINTLLLPRSAVFQKKEIFINEAHSTAGYLKRLNVRKLIMVGGSFFGLQWLKKRK